MGSPWLGGGVALPGLEAELVQDAARHARVGHCWSWAASDGAAPPSPVEVHMCRDLCRWASRLAAGTPRGTATEGHIATLDAYQNNPAQYEGAVWGVVQDLLDFFVERLPTCVVTHAQPPAGHLVAAQHQEVVHRLLMVGAPGASAATRRAALLAVHQYSALNAAFLELRIEAGRSVDTAYGLERAVMPGVTPKEQASLWENYAVLSQGGAAVAAQYSPLE